MTVSQTQAVDVLRGRLALTAITPAEIEQIIELILALVPLFSAAAPVASLPKAS
jgi:hypothetical protein